MAAELAERLPRTPRGASIAPPMRAVAGRLELDGVRRDLHQRVLSYVGLRVNSREDAEDISQEVMLRIHRHSAELLHVERMSAWVYRIAGNAITDYYRRAARREVPSGHAADVGEPEPDTAASAWMEPDTDQLRQQLAASLNAYASAA